MVKLCLKIKNLEGDTISYHIHYAEDDSPVKIFVTKEKRSAAGEKSPEAILKENVYGQAESNNNSFSESYIAESESRSQE